MQKPDKNVNQYSWSNSRGFDSQTGGGGRALLMAAISMYIMLILVVIIGLGIISTRVLSSHRPSSIKTTPPTDSIQPAISDYTDESYGYPLSGIAGVLSKSAVTVEIGVGGSYGGSAVFGLAISADGYIISGSERLVTAETIRVTDLHGNHYPARLVGSDASTGLTVIKADGGVFEPPETVSDIKAGDRCALYGSISGVNFSVVESSFVSAHSIINYRSGSIALRGDFVGVSADTGTDCVIAADRIGRVAAISCYLPDGSVANRYLLSVGAALDVAHSIINNGFVADRFRPGFQCEPITDELSQKLGVAGVKITYIEPDSPILSRGVSVGDIIISVNNLPIADADLLWAAVAQAGTSSIQLRIYDIDKGSSITLTSNFIEDRG